MRSCCVEDAEAGVEAQRLLLPEVVRLDRGRPPSPRRSSNRCARWEVQAEEFGERTLAIHALPRVVGSLDAGQLIHNLLAELCEEEGREVGGQRRWTSSGSGWPTRSPARRPSRRATVSRPSEIEALLARRDSLGTEAETCPHGRPTFAPLLARRHGAAQFKRK